MFNGTQSFFDNILNQLLLEYNKYSYKYRKAKIRKINSKRIRIKSLIVYKFID